MISPRLLPLALGLAGLSLVGCGKKAAEAPSAPPVVNIGQESVTVLQPVELTDGPTLSGSLTAERQATLRAEVAGKVLSISVEQGQKVGRGAQIMRLDATAITDQATSARATIMAAQSNLDLAQTNEQRMSRLAAAGAVAQSQLDAARTQTAAARGQLAQARAGLAGAQKQVGNTTIQAPFAGVVSERTVSVGDIVQPGTALATVIDPSSLRLEASIPAAQLSRVKIGDAVSFTVTGYGDRTFTGKISRINPAADPATRQVRLYIDIPNSGNTLVAGLFAQGRVASQTRTAVAVPQNAVDQRGIEPTVNRLRGGMVQKVAVALGIVDEATEQVEITKGLAAGDTVLIGAAQGIADSTRIRVTTGVSSTQRAGR